MRLLASTSLALIFGLGAISLAAPTAAQAQASIGISVGFAPPALPYYYQPRIPAYGYIWTPGFWAWYGEIQDYYWVPGTWVRPPRIGLLWTPGYWGWNNGLYIFSDGYWGANVGYYGGINYGYGYGGHGYDGGEWRHGRLYYNRSANNIVNARIPTVYNHAVGHAGPGRVSFNGGAGGVLARPSAAQLAGSRGPHVAYTADQQRHLQSARGEPALRSKVNHGAPAILATARPAALHEAGAVTAGRAAPSGSNDNRTRVPARPERESGRVQQQAPAQRAAPEAQRAPQQGRPNADRGGPSGGDMRQGQPGNRPAAQSGDRSGSRGPDAQRQEQGQSQGQPGGRPAAQGGDRSGSRGPDAQRQEQGRGQGQPDGGRQGDQRKDKDDQSKRPPTDQ